MPKTRAPDPEFDFSKIINPNASQVENQIAIFRAVNRAADVLLDSPPIGEPEEDGYRRPDYGSRAMGFDLKLFARGLLRSNPQQP